MNVALVLAGGTGTRLGAAVPKQYIEVDGKPIISYCMDTISKCHIIDGIYIVADSMWHDYIKQNVDMSKVKGFVEPGENRQLSIYNGLMAMKNFASNEDVVLIHDGARPLVSEEMICQCISNIEGHDGVMPVLPVKDTLYVSENGSSVSKLLDREKIFRGQAPEAFLYEKYLKANEALLPDEIKLINGSTEPAVMAGLDVLMISGDERNFKITTEKDLEDFRSRINESICIK